MTTADSHSKLAFAICSHLRAIEGKEDDKEGVEVAIQCIQALYNIDIDTDTHLKTDDSLLTIFTNYIKNAPKKEQKQTANVEDRAKADLLKAEGNKKMAGKAYKEAIELYSQAIALDEQNSVYYANRSAAYSQNQQYAEAAKDGQKSIDLDPGYSKGYARLGHALFGQGKFDEAVVAYEKGLKLEPDNASMKQSLAAASQKAGKVASSSSPSGGFPGMPAGMDLGSMMSQPGT